jgi:hypothetical protein
MIITDSACTSLIEFLSEKYILTYNKYRGLLTLKGYDDRYCKYMANGKTLNQCLKNMLEKYEDLFEKVKNGCI